MRYTYIYTYIHVTCIHTNKHTYILYIYTYIYKHITAMMAEARLRL